MTLYLYIIGTIMAFCLFEEAYDRAETTLPEWARTTVKVGAILSWPLLVPVFLIILTVRRIRAQ